MKLIRLSPLILGIIVVFLHIVFCLEVHLHRNLLPESVTLLFFYLNAPIALVISSVIHSSRLASVFGLVFGSFVHFILVYFLAKLTIYLGSMVFRKTPPHAA